MNKIWCLFSVENNYDQPDNNLVTWWEEKPSLEKLAKFLCQPLDKASDEAIMAVVEIWKGNRTVTPGDSTSYRLEQVEASK